MDSAGLSRVWWNCKLVTRYFDFAGLRQEKIENFSAINWINVRCSKVFQLSQGRGFRGLDYS